MNKTDRNLFLFYSEELISLTTIYFYFYFTVRNYLVSLIILFLPVINFQQGAIKRKCPRSASPPDIGK